MSEIGLHRRERAGAVDAVYLGQARVFDGVTDRGTGAVRLHHADGAGVHARRSQRRPVHRDLRVQRRCRDVHGTAILIGGRAAHHSQDPVTIPQRIRQPLEQHHCATLGRHEPVRRDVERMAASGRRQHALRRARGRLPRIKYHRGAAREGKVAFALVQAATGHMQSEPGRKNMPCPL